MESYNNNSSSPSLKQRFKSTFSNCFSHLEHENQNNHNLQRSTSHGSKHVNIKDGNCTTHHQESHSVDAVKDKCKNFISRLGGSGGGSARHQHQNHHHNQHKGHRRRHSSSADFRYDALSYSLNFDQGVEDERLDEFPFKSFSARLPATPPREQRKVGPAKKIVGLS